MGADAREERAVTHQAPPSQLACRLYDVQARIHGFDTARARERLTNAVVRGAIVGGSFRGGLNIVTLALRLLARRRRRGAEPGGRHRPAQQLVRDTLRWAAFLGAYGGVAVLVDEAIALLGGKRRTQAWRGMAAGPKPRRSLYEGVSHAGLAAGPTLLLTGSKETHSSVALYVLIRGLALLVRCGNLPSAAPWKRRHAGHGHWDWSVPLPRLACSHRMTRWPVLPYRLLAPTRSATPGSLPLRPPPPPTWDSLTSYEAIREQAARGTAGLPPARLSALRGTPHEAVVAAVPCAYLHPGLSCSGHAAAFLPEAFLRALPVYLPVYAIPALLVHRHCLFAPGAPLLWAKMAAGIARSSLFLGLYVALAYRGACAGFTAAGRTSGAPLVAGCWAGGLATLVEKKSRRMELALYCVSRSLESLGACFMDWGWVRPHALPQRIDILMFSLASACILHCYSDHMGARRCVFRSKYLSGFDWCLGNEGFHDSSIRHVPSNADLLQPAMVRVMRSVRSMAALAGLGNGALRRSRESGGGEGSGTSPGRAHSA
eukprot:scaffold20.g7657.t1